MTFFLQIVQNHNREMRQVTHLRNLVGRCPYLQLTYSFEIFWDYRRQNQSLKNEPPNWKAIQEAGVNSEINFSSMGSQNKILP